MRLWSLHPQYLDSAGLVAVWREGLLAQAVLHELTRGYRHHPQLTRFREHVDPRAAIAHYLSGIVEEAEHRGYRFDATKILHEGRGRSGRRHRRLSVTEGQLLFEWEHLKQKVLLRAEPWYRRIVVVSVPLPHPAFVVIPGGVAEWERAASAR